MSLINLLLQILRKNQIIKNKNIYNSQILLEYDCQYGVQELAPLD